MAILDLAGTLNNLQAERSRILQEVTKLDKAIDVIRDLSGTEPTPNGNTKKWTMSAAARRKIAKAQTLRWAKVRQQQKKAA